MAIIYIRYILIIIFNYIKLIIGIFYLNKYIMLDIKQSMCNGNIILEPRLQHYMEKIKYYKTNNLEIPIFLDKQYNIIEEDKTKIKAFMSGDKNIYKTSYQNKYVKEEIIKPSFPDHNYKKDPRFDRFKIKMQRDKEEIKKRHDYSNYDNYYKKQAKATEYQISESKYTPSYNGNQNRDMFLDKNYTNKDNSNFTNYKPKMQNSQIHYKQYHGSSIDKPHENELTNIIGRLDSYADKDNTIYTYNHEMDTENKICIPSNNTQKSYLNTTKYVPVPSMWKKSGPSTDLYGSSNSSRKSIENRNSSEHFFSYISSDIQDPNHIVLPFPRGGIDTREMNKKTANVREINL
jgi:hypothetical protein